MIWIILSRQKFTLILVLLFISYEIQAQVKLIPNSSHESVLSFNDSISDDPSSLKSHYSSFRSFFPLSNCGYILTDRGLHLYKKDSIYPITLFAPTHFAKDGNSILGIDGNTLAVFDGKRMISYNRIILRPHNHDAVLAREDEPNVDAMNEKKLKLFLMANNSQSIYLLSSTELFTVNKSDFTVQSRAISWGNIHPAFNDYKKYPEQMVSNDKGDLIITLTYDSQLLLYKDSVWLQGSLPLDFRGVRKSKKITQDANGNFYISCPETKEHFEIVNYGIIRTTFSLPPKVDGFNLLWIKNESEMCGVIDNACWILQKGVWKQYVLSKESIAGLDFLEIKKGVDGLFYLVHQKKGVFIVKP